MPIGKPFKKEIMKKQETSLPAAAQDSTEISEKQAALERLRLSKESLPHELLENGRRQGSEFVLKANEADESMRRRMERADDFGVQPETIDGLLEIMYGEDGWGRRDSVKQFEYDYGSDIYEPEWVQGFHEGVLSQFRDLEHKLNTEKSV